MYENIRPPSATHWYLAHLYKQNPHSAQPNIKEAAEIVKTWTNHVRDITDRLKQTDIPVEVCHANDNRLLVPLGDLFTE